jgi:hypothetical protein
MTVVKLRGTSSKQTVHVARALAVLAALVEFSMGKDSDDKAIVRQLELKSM